MYYNFEIPNLDSEFKNKCIEWIHNSIPFQKIMLGEGHCCVNFVHIIEMLRCIEGEGNNYILLCGASCYNDILLIDNYKIVLKEYKIILLYDYVIPKERAYLIPMKSYEPLELSNKIVLFERE